MSSLALSPSFSKSSRPALSTRLPDQSYVLSLASLPSYIAASASAPSNAIHLLDKADIRTVVQTLPGHAKGTDCLRAVKNFCDRQDVLLSCGKDGNVVAWDERTGGIGVKMSQPSGGARGLFSCDASDDGLLVAAGSELKGEDALILYWDPRNPVAPLRKHTSTHSDDITSVRFSPNNSSSAVLLSASTDGLVALSNPNEDNEDEAVLNVGNWGCSIARAGWVENGDGLAWASSDMETLSLWNSELDTVHDVDRDRIKYPSTDLTWVTDYIIDCQTTPEGEFVMLAGSNEGDFALLTAPKPISANGQWSLERVFSSRHTGVVRSAVWDFASNVILSGGEDSLINVWSCPALSDAGRTQDDGMDVDQPPKRRFRGDDDADEFKRSRRF